MYCKLRAIFQQSETGPFIPTEPQRPGAELGGCQGGHCPPKIFRVTSCHWSRSLSESPTQTIDSSPCCKTGPSSGPPKWKCLAPPLSTTKNKSGQIVWSSFDEHKNGHFVYFNRKRLDNIHISSGYINVSMELRFFRTQQGTRFAFKIHCTIQIKCVLFERNCRFRLHYVAWYFCKMYNFVRQHYVGL